VPWAFDDEAVDVTRRFTRLKLALMPYLARVGREVTTEGVGVMRPMLLEFPEDPAVAHLDRQYLLGDSLLVAPVFSAEGRVDYYVPAGRWTSLLDGHTVTGPGWVTEEHDFSSVPLLVRPDTVLPLGARTDTPEYAWADGVTLALVALAVGDRDVVVPGRQGSPDTVFAVSRREDTLTVRRTAGPAGHGTWRVVVPGTDPARLGVVGGRVVAPSADLPYALAGATVEVDGDTVEIHLEGGAR
jgi:alpha-D-xyloside xylohydrolase